MWELCVWLLFYGVILGRPITAIILLRKKKLAAFTLIVL